MQLKPSFHKRRTAYSLNTKTIRSIKHKTHLSDLQFPNFSQGFHPFSYSSSPYGSNTTAAMTFFKVSDSQDVSKSDIDIILQQNKSKLGTISKKVSQKRKQEYSNYLSNNTKHCKLLELNNIRSRMMTSLKSNVGEIFVKVMDEHKPEDYQYVVQFSRVPTSGWKPESREGQSCVVYKDTLYLIGGHNSNPLADVCSYNFKEGSWAKVAETDIERSYHTTVVYKDHYFIVFGGMSRYNTYYKSRDCLNSTLLFNPLAGGVKTIKLQNEHIVQPRRSHSSCIVGKQMLVFGGINMFKSHLKDMVYLDFKQLKWVELDYYTETPELEEFLAHGIAKHAMIENFKSRQGHAKLSNRDYEPDEGIFVFGGTNQIGIKSTLFQICFKRRIPRLHKLYPSGYVPSGVSPIVSRVNPNVIAVVSGERAQREIKLYKIKENEFVGVHLTNSLQLGGIGSSIVRHQNEMYVLFGVGQKGYIGAISSFKLEQKLKSQIEKEGKKKRQSFALKDLRVLPTFTHLQTVQ